MNFQSFIPRWLGGGYRREQGNQTNQSLITWKGKKQNVTEETAMQISAVWAAVQLKAKTIASLELNFYQMDKGGRKPANDHPVQMLFRGRPNRYQTRVEFFETVGLNLYLTGNAYVRIERSETGRIRSLMPLMSSQMEVDLQQDGTIIYKYTTNVGEETGQLAYPEEAIWHIKLFGNGIVGLSPLRHASQSIGLAISGEEWANNIVGNGGKPSGVLMFDKVLTKEQRSQMRERFKDIREGDRDALMVLEAGMTYQQVSLSPEDVQLLASRRFQIEDIARFFDVPSVLINDTSGSTVWGSGIEQIITGWYKLQFRSELERFETSMLNKLLSPAERVRMSVEFEFDELLRTDFRTRVAAGREAVGAGLMTRNEWRRREWLPEIPGADELTAQVNLVNLDDLAKVVNGGDNDER